MKHVKYIIYNINFINIFYFTNGYFLSQKQYNCHAPNNDTLFQAY